MNRNAHIRLSSRTTNDSFTRQNSLRSPRNEDRQANIQLHSPREAYIHRQNSDRIPADDLDTFDLDTSDLDPDIEGQKFYASMQRLIEHFQHLDTDRQRQINDDLEVVVPDVLLNRQASFRQPPNRGSVPYRSFRKTSAEQPTIERQPKFVSAGDIPSYVDDVFDGTDDDQPQTIGYFQRGVPVRHTIGRNVSGIPKNAGGYFGVRLSQRQTSPRETHTTRSLSANHGQSPAFQRSLSLDRRDRYATPNKRENPKTRHVTYDSDTAAMLTSGSASDATTSVDYVSDSGAAAMPTRHYGTNNKQLLSPRNSAMRRSTHTMDRNKLQREAKVEHNPMVASALRDRYPEKDYKVTKVSSTVSSPDVVLNGGVGFRRDDNKRKMIHHQPMRDLVHARADKRPKSLLKRTGDGHVDIADNVNQSSSVVESTSEPHILTNNGRKYLQLTVDVGGFKPKDIQIITQGKLLQVIAKGTVLKKTDSPTGATRVFRELKRQFALPDMVSAEHLQGVLNENGVLLIEGPLGYNDTGKKRKSKRVKFVLD